MENADEEFNCSICLEMLTPPIRITRCGHNFCEECLKNLCSSSRKPRCPICRTPFEITRNDVTKMTRNRMLEKAINKLIRRGGSVGPAPTTLSKDAVAQLQESADALINDGKYNKALDILKTIVINEKRTNKIPPMIQKLSCEIDGRLYSDAETTGREIANLIESKEFEKKENNNSKQIYHNKLHSIAMKLIKIKHFNLALLLVQIQLNLIKHSYSVQEKLTKLQNLGISLTDISKNLHYKKDLKKVKEIYLLYDKVLNDMQSINDIDLKIKTENIAWFMYYYGTGCNFMKDFNKSMVIFPKAIFLMKANLSDNANNYVVYGICHHNYANVLIETKRLIEAKERFEEALKIFEEATDWPNEEQKINKFIITISAIDEINFRLTSDKRSWLNRLARLCLYTAQNIRHALKRE